MMNITQTLVDRLDANDYSNFLAYGDRYDASPSTTDDLSLDNDTQFQFISYELEKSPIVWDLCTWLHQGHMYR